MIMKKILIYSFAALLFIVACRKSDNPLLPKNLARVPAPLITIDSTGDLTISAQNPDVFKGKVKIAGYYGNNISPAKFDVVVIKNGDASNVKILQAGLTTLPMVVTITGTQLHTLFGTPIVSDDSFDIGANIIMQDGTVYPAFSTSPGTIYTAGILSQPGFNPTVRFVAICKFTATDYGAFGVPTPYVVQQDGWGDYHPGDIVNVTVIDATHLSFKYLANNAQPIIIIVNPVTNSTSVAGQTIGDYGPPFGIFSVVSVPNNANAVTPCSLGVGVTLHFTESKGADFGNWTIILTKQ
jgi:hypothetical protein